MLRIILDKGGIITQYYDDDESEMKNHIMIVPIKIAKGIMISVSIVLNLSAYKRQKRYRML